MIILMNQEVLTVPEITAAVGERILESCTGWSWQD